jgi:hypothetical protein
MRLPERMAFTDHGVRLPFATPFSDHPLICKKSRDEAL